MKYDNRLRYDFTCLLGVRQGEYLSPFSFSMYYVNDLEETLAGDDFKCVEVGMLKLLLFYMLIFYFFQNLQKAYKKVYIF